MHILLICRTLFQCFDTVADKTLLYPLKHKDMASSTTSKIPQDIGFIGLGLMGLPMATNLVKKMDKSTTFYVYDVVEEAVMKFVEAGEGRVKACASSKEVADKSVCEQCLPINILNSPIRSAMDKN